MYDILIALGALAAIISALPSLGVDVRIFGRGKVVKATVEVGIPKWRWWLVVAIASLALIASSINLYRNSHRDALHFPVRDKEKIYGKMFRNEKVLLDGKSFEKVTFENVTYLVNGTAPFDLVNCTFSGSIQISTDSDSVASGLLLSKELGLIRQDAPVFRTDPNGNSERMESAKPHPEP
jgi:hypothetical protein